MVSAQYKNAHNEKSISHAYDFFNATFVNSYVNFVFSKFIHGGSFLRLSDEFVRVADMLIEK